MGVRVGNQGSTSFVAVVAFVLGVALITGCTSSNVVKPAGLWNPCTSIPDSAVVAAGLNPATKTADVAGVKFEGWNVCRWKGAWYFLNLYSTDSTFDSVKQNEKYKDFQSIAIGDRKSIRFVEVGDTDHGKCDVAFDVPQGAILFQLNTSIATGKQGDPCAELTRLANALENSLPTGK